MALSNDLISQFVKITNDNSKKKTETTVYGKVETYNGKPYVKLDGSDLLTPISTTADVKDGERVTVMIKNHSAIVTGNISSPSGSAKDVAQVKQDMEDLDVNSVKGKIAEFEVLLAGKVDAEELNAEKARIETLLADTVEITEKLTAVDADIKNLKATKLDANIASITYATIKSLEATEASIHNLEATYADIATMIFGSATGNVIQTSFSNAVIGQLGDAQIKSAMIESINANKISSGDIITNNVRVMSEDGSLIISDETIQISDGARVRVQIGKDASDDYSINIWDENGNLMFSKGGITDSAIKDAIIRNDMISDTANISAHKLDIDSLFEEINDSSNTIKSSKVYLDEEKQTLDVVFKSLTTDVNDLDETVSSQGTQISAIQGQISSKIWQQDIDAAKGEMSTQYSTLDQKVDSISSSVASHTTAITNVESSVTQLSNKITSNVNETTNLGTRMSTVEQTASGLTARVEDIEDVGVHGRNLLANTAFGPASAHKRYNSSGTISRTTDGLKLTCTSDSTRTGFMLPLATEGILVNGQKYTLSFQYRTNITSTGTIYALQKTSPNVNVSGGSDLIVSETDWQNFVLTFSSNSINDRICQAILIPYANGVNNWIEIKDKTLKLEKGDTATEWTSAPEDASSAAKTATDYLSFSSSGLIVGDMNASTLGKNVLIDSDSVDIRNGSTTLASFGASTVTLGRNAEDSVIDLCNGAGKISANTASAATSYPNRNAILIESQEIETESVRFVASTSNKYGATSTPSITRGTEVYMQRSTSTTSESCARLKAEHKTTSSGAYTSSGISAMTYDSASTTRAMVFASDSANSSHNQVNVYPTKTTMNKNLVLNGTTFTGKNKVLWTGGYYMSDTQTATLSEAISAQANGAVLVWSEYTNGESSNANFQMTYIPKHFITLHAGKGVSTIVANGSMNIMATKYVYVSDTSIKGYAGNDDAATAKDCGITSTANRFVLRYVIGV